MRSKVNCLFAMPSNSLRVRYFSPLNNQTYCCNFLSIEREFSGKDLDSLDEEKLRNINIEYVTIKSYSNLFACFV